MHDICIDRCQATAVNSRVVGGAKELISSKVGPAGLQWRKQTTRSYARSNAMLQIVRIEYILQSLFKNLYTSTALVMPMGVTTLEANHEIMQSGFCPSRISQRIFSLHHHHHQSSKHGDIYNQIVHNSASNNREYHHKRKCFLKVQEM